MRRTVLVFLILCALAVGFGVGIAVGLRLPSAPVQTNPPQTDTAPTFPVNVRQTAASTRLMQREHGLYTDILNKDMIFYDIYIPLENTLCALGSLKTVKTLNARDRAIAEQVLQEVTVDKLKKSISPILAASAFVELSRLVGAETPYETEVRELVQNSYRDEGFFSFSMEKINNTSQSQSSVALSDTYHASIALGDHIITDQQKEQIADFLMIQLEDAEKQIRDEKIYRYFDIVVIAENFELWDRLDRVELEAEMLRLFEYAPYSYTAQDLYYLCIVPTFSLGEYADQITENLIAQLEHADPEATFYIASVLARVSTQTVVNQMPLIVRNLNDCLTYDRYYVYESTVETLEATYYANQIAELLLGRQLGDPVAFPELDLSQFEPDDLVYLGLLKELDQTEQTAFQKLAMQELSADNGSNLSSLTLILEVLHQNQAVPRELVDAYADYSDSITDPISNMDPNASAYPATVLWRTALDLCNKSYLGIPVAQLDVRELVGFFVLHFNDSFAALEQVYHVVRLCQLQGFPLDPITENAAFMETLQTIYQNHFDGTFFTFDENAKEDFQSTYYALYVLKHLGLLEGVPTSTAAVD